MRRCSVPGCRSNFRPPYVSVFSFPKDPNISKLWLKNIGRPSLKIHENIGVCIKHFEKHVICGISGSDSHRKKITIKHGSVPTIFEDDPSAYEDCKMEGNLQSLDKNARMQKSAKNSLSAGSDLHIRKTSKGDSTQSSPVKSPKKSSLTTDRPIIAVIKAQDLIADDNMDDDDDDCVMEQPSSSSASFSLPSPFKNLPSVSVCLKEEDRVPFTRESKGIKRSPSTGSNSSTGSSEQQKPGAITKRRKVEKPAPVVLGRDNDCYCWVCHRENIILCCIACPRAYHSKCAGETSIVSPDWVCPECQRILAAENVDTRSSTLAEISLDKLGALLKLSLNKMKLRAPPAFHQPVPLEQYPLYLHYVIHPMDLSFLEKNIKNKVYGCTEAFLADVKWISHNSCVFNGTQYPLSNSAKNLVKACEQDMQEIEVCPDCFVHSIVRNKYWFSEVCRKPHPLVWAKLKGFPYWPAKVVRILDGNVDARFFGAHDRAWVPVSQCYHLSKEMPTSSKPKKKGNYEAALDELNVHVHLLIQKFGCFEYAAYRTIFNPENKCLMYHGIDIEKASKEDISFDTASPSKMRFHSPEKESRFASYMESETEKASVDEEKLQGGLPEDATKVSQTITENPLSFLFKDKLVDSSSTSNKKGLSQNSSERSSSEEKGIDSAEEKQSTSKAPTLKKPEAISDSDQLRKLELVLERIKGYVSPNVDSEKDAVDNKNEENEKRDEEESTSETQNNDEKETPRQIFPKSSPIRDSFLIPIIEKCKVAENISESSENINVSAAATEKKDYLKLNNIIESCKAMLGISNVADDVDNESVADENASRSDDEEDDNSTSEADEENSSLSEGEAEDETGNAEASDEEASGAEIEIVEGDESSEAEVTDDSDYEGEVEEDSSSGASDTDVEDDSIKGQLSKNPKETQNENCAKDISEVNDVSSTNPDAELSKAVVSDSSKLGDNEESCSMDVIDNTNKINEACDQPMSLENTSVDKEIHAASEVQDDSNQEIENSSLPVPLNVKKPTSIGDFVSSKRDTSALLKNRIKYESEDVKGSYFAQRCTTNQLSKSATDNHQPSNNEEEDDEIMICDSPPARPKPPVIVLDDDQENEDSSVSDTNAIKSSPHSTSAESIPYDERYATCRMNFNDERDSSSPKGVLVNGNASENTSIGDGVLKDKASESTENDKKRNLSFDDSSEDDIQIVTAVKRSKLTGAIRTFNKPIGSPLISVPPRQEFQEENLGKENRSPMKIASPSLDKEQNSDKGEDFTPPVTTLKSPVIDTSHLNDKDKEILLIKSKLNCVLKAYHIQSWKCTQEREELRHNMNLIIMEMRACLEADKKQAIETLTRTFEQEKLKCIDETKKKQWCASCRMESRYACCWNTSYCSVNCQKRHFPEHKTFCTQVKNRYTGIASDAVEGKQKVAPNLTENSEKGNKLIILNMKPTEPAKNVPDLSSVSSQQTPTSKPQIQVVTAKNSLQVAASQCTSSPIQFILAPMKSSTPVSIGTETIKSSSSLPLNAVHMPVTSKSPSLSTVPSSVPTPIQSSAPILLSSSVMSLSAPSTTSMPSTITNEDQNIDTTQIINGVRNKSCDLGTAISLLTKKNLESSQSILKAKVESKKPKEDTNLEEIYFPSPPAVTFEGYDTVSPEPNLVIDQFEGTKDNSDAETEGSDKSEDVNPEQDVILSDDEDINNEMVDIGRGIKVQAKFLNKCIVYGVTAKKLTRCLVDVIFPDIKLLATCSAFGQKSNVTKLTRAALPTRKVYSIINFVRKRFPMVTRSEIVLAINMKCKEARVILNRMDKEPKTKAKKSTKGKNVASTTKATSVPSTTSCSTDSSSTTQAVSKTVPNLVCVKSSNSLQSSKITAFNIPKTTAGPNVFHCNSQILIHKSPVLKTVGSAAIVQSSSVKSPQKQKKNCREKTIKELLSANMIRSAGKVAKEGSQIVMAIDKLRAATPSLQSVTTTSAVAGQRPFIIIGSAVNPVKPAAPAQHPAVEIKPSNKK